jgi:hypothetical protein
MNCIFTRNLCCSEASPIFLERYYMWNVTAMDPVWLTEVASHFYHSGNTVAGVESGR